MLNFHVHRYGHPHLPVILFLHGFLGSSKDYAPLLVELSATFHCIAVDLPGHGNTQADQYDLASTAHGLMTLLGQLGIDRPSGLVGYSLGGRIALYLALHYPACWAKVLLESASAGLASATARQERQQRDLAIARKLRQPDLDFAQFIHNWYRQPVFQGTATHPQFPALVAQRLQNRPGRASPILRISRSGQSTIFRRIISQQSTTVAVASGCRRSKVCHH